MANITTVKKVKAALGASNVNYENLTIEIMDLIDSAKADMALAGVVLPAENPESDALILRAILTFCKMNYGEGVEYDRMKKSYDEQKAQLKTSTGYTEWNDVSKTND